MIVSRVSQAITRGFMNLGRHRARQVLLAQNDRLLADNGFSRDLLEQGISAWPWQILATDSGIDTAGCVDRSKAIQQDRDQAFEAAIIRLNRYSDAELFDSSHYREAMTETPRQGGVGVESLGDSATDDRAAA